MNVERFDFSGQLRFLFRLLIFIFLNFILFFNFAILYWFCHISKWIRHRYTCVPHPEPSSLLPPHTISLGHPSAPAPSIFRSWMWIFFQKGIHYYSLKIKVVQSCPTLCNPMNSLGQNTGVGSRSLLRGSSQPRDRTQVSRIAGSFFSS